jgi:hypothetical protein
VPVGAAAAPWATSLLPTRQTSPELKSILSFEAAVVVAASLSGVAADPPTSVAIVSGSPDVSSDLTTAVVDEIASFSAVAANPPPAVDIAVGSSAASSDQPTADPPVRVDNGRQLSWLTFSVALAATVALQKCR